MKVDFKKQLILLQDDNFLHGEWAPDDSRLSPWTGTVTYTNMEIGEVKFGPLAFSKRSMLEATGFYGGVCVSQFRSGRVIWDFSARDPMVNRYAYALEIDACRQTIINARKLNLISNSSKPVNRKGYTTFDLKVTKKLSNLILALKGINIFNKGYREIERYKGF